MKNSRALRLAIEALKRRNRELAFDANMAKVYKAVYPAAVNNLKKLEDNEKAIEIIEKIIEVGKGGNVTLTFASRSTCNHEFKNGACVNCGQFEFKTGGSNES